MLELPWLLAFSTGVVSALSLPLGTLTAGIWTPSARATAALMAFGGGALLAALTLDLVGTAVSRGHIYPLAFGCILGGLMFIALNEAVNHYGAFVRKASTAFYHLRGQDHRRVQRLLTSLKAVDVFCELPIKEFRALAAAVYSRHLHKGMAVYRRHDPADNLYVLAEGAVEVVRDPTGTGPGERVAKNEAFGWLAFLTGTPHVSTAVAVSDTTVWCVPRDSFVHLLPNSPTLLQAVHRWLRSTEIFSYLAQRQGMGTEAAQVWCDAVVESLGRRGTVPPARSVERQAERFVTIAPTITRFSLFSELSEDERRLVACRLLYKRHRRGDTFFLKGDPADRLYVLDEGEVSLVDPADLVRRPELVRPHGAFGCRALLIGGRHTTAALATEDTAVWVLGAKTSSLASYPRMSYAWWPVVSYTSGTGAGTRFF